MRAARILHAMAALLTRVRRSLSWLGLVPAAVRQRLSSSGRTLGPTRHAVPLPAGMSAPVPAHVSSQVPEQRPGEHDSREASVGEGGNKRLRLVV